MPINFLPIGLSLLGGLFGAITESPQERAMREARLRGLEAARRLGLAAERQRDEAERYSREVESTRRYGAGTIASLANQEAIGLYGRLLSRQQALMSAAMNAARAGLNVNVNPALTEVFSDIGRAGSEIEKGRGERLLQNERMALEGQSRAQSMRQQADLLGVQAEQMRQRAEEFGAQGARGSTWISNALSGAILGTKLGNSVLDFNEALSGNGNVGNVGTEMARVPTSQGIVNLVAEPLSQYSSPNNLGYLPYLQGGEQFSDENRRRYELNRAIYEDALYRSGLKRTKQDVVNEFGEAFRLRMPNRIPYIEYRAMGGRVEAGKPYIVGDSPTGEITGNEELFIPDQSGTIVPSKNTQMMMAQGQIPMSGQMPMAGVGAGQESQFSAQGGSQKSPRLAFLQSILEEVALMNEKDDEIASRILDGTGLENLLLGKRKTRRQKAVDFVMK